MAIKILVSEELKEILKTFKASSQVASLLLGDYIDEEFLVDSYVNYLTISKGDPTKISYLSLDRTKGLTETECWESSRRYQSRPGGLVSKIFKNISGKEIEVFSNLFISQVNKPKLRFEIYKGNDIKKFYHYENYRSGSGSLGASCMKHEHCQNYFQLYTENPDNVSMLTMFVDNDHRCVGRALLWDFDSYKIMDRIYTINDETYSYYFKQWATENDYYFKSEQNWFNTMYFEQIGKERKEFKMQLDLKNTSFSKFPYMDTFKFMDMNSGRLYNYIPEDKRNVRTLCGSEGSTQANDYLVFDEISLVLRYRNDAAHITYLETPLYTGRDNAYYSNYNDMWILREHSVYNETIGDYIFNEEYKERNSPEIEKAIARRLEEMKKYEEMLKKKSKSKGVPEGYITLDTDFASFYGEVAGRGYYGDARPARAVTRRATTEIVDSEIEAPSPEVVAQELNQTRRDLTIREQERLRNMYRQINNMTWGNPGWRTWGTTIQENPTQGEPMSEQIQDTTAQTETTQNVDTRPEFDPIATSTIDGVASSFRDMLESLRVPPSRTESVDDDDMPF